MTILTVFFPLYIYGYIPFTFFFSSRIPILKNIFIENEFNTIFNLIRFEWAKDLKITLILTVVWCVKSNFLFFFSFVFVFSQLIYHSYVVYYLLQLHQFFFIICESKRFISFVKFLFYIFIIIIIIKVTVKFFSIKVTTLAFQTNKWMNQVVNVIVVVVVVIVNFFFSLLTFTVNLKIESKLNEWMNE